MAPPELPAALLSQPTVDQGRRRTSACSQGARQLTKEDRAASTPPCVRLGAASTPPCPCPTTGLVPSRTRSGRGNRVQLAVSALGGLPGAQVYHSSVLLDGLEFSFGAMPGLVMASGAISHKPVGGTPKIFDLGFSERTPRQLATALGPYFKRGTYDLLRKNCNTFSDCAIFFLLGVRLDTKYRSLDQLGANFPGVVQMGTFGFYRPNRAADGFDVEVLVQSMSKRTEGMSIDVSCKAAAPAESLWEAAEHFLQAAGGLWAGCAQLPCQQRAPALEPERLKCKLRAKEAARAHDATSRIGGA